MKEALKIFDFLQEFVYISDMTTHELIYLNQTAKRFLGLPEDGEVAGRLCYEVIQGKDAPCAFCTNSQLRNRMFIEWKHYNDVMGKTLLLRDTMFETEGRRYRLEIGSDILDADSGSDYILRSYRTHETIIHDGLKIALTPNDPDEGIRDFLAYVGKKAGADRVYIVESSGHIYEWCREGVSSDREKIQSGIKETLKVWQEAFDGEDNLMIFDAEDIRDSHPAMCRTLKRRLVKTLIACQLKTEGEFSGFCGFDNPPSEYMEACTGFLNILSQYLEILISKRDYIKEKSYQICYDHLTGLYNREYFFEEVNRIMREKPLRKKWMMLVNIKDFKLINNIYGNEFGDHVLRVQGNVTRKYMKPDTICGRIYGDKFALLVQRETYDSDAFYEGFSEISGQLGMNDFALCHHVVVCNITGSEKSAENIFNCLSIGEKSINNRHELILTECDCDEIEMEYTEYAEILSRFHHALLHHQFKMFLQPHVNKKGKIVGGEALARWDQPTRGLTEPRDFLPLIEKSGLIHKLDLYMWRKAAENIARWNHKGYEDWHISVNVSAGDFYSMDVYKELTGLAEEYGINPGHLILEMTETVIIENFDTVSTVMRRLRDYGFQIAVDDFGKGHSSLSTIVEMPFDIIKFDRAFLDKPVSDDSKNNTVLKALVNLVRKLDAVTIFEGIESKEQLEFLRRMGVDYFQGYYFDKPMYLEEFEEKYMGV